MCWAKRTAPGCRRITRAEDAANRPVKLGYTNAVEFGGITTWPGSTNSETESQPG